MKNRDIYVKEENNLIYIGNSLIELGFDIALGGALVSFIDQTTKYQFIQHDEEARTLFRISLDQAEQGQNVIDSRDFGSCKWHYLENAHGIILIIENELSINSNYKVITSISVYESSPLSTWKLDVTFLCADKRPKNVTFPVLSGVMKVGCNPPGETLVTARNGEGHLFRNPYPMEDRLPLKGGFGLDVNNVGVGEIHGMYPGRQSMQFMLYYNDFSGIYLATHDAGMNVKSFDIGKTEGVGEHPVMSITHIVEPNQDCHISIEYDTVLGVFQGDWYNGADIYKEWAIKQWWCAKTLAEKDLPEWFHKGFGIFQMSNYGTPRLEVNHSLDKIAGVVNGLSQKIGVPLFALIFNWEGKGAWTAPKGMFPPREGEENFKSAMRLLNDKGNYGFVYIAAGNWYIKLPYEPVFDNWKEFESEGRQNAITDANGKVKIESWFKNWEHTHTCPGTEYIKEQTAWEITECLKLGCNIVQIDNFPACEPEACFNSEHGHPLGYGRWWAEEFNRLLNEARLKAKKVMPGYVLSGEGICECFIQNLDLYDQRAGNFEYFCHLEGKDFPAGGECIPLFNYVYNKYIASYLAAFNDCNRPEVLYWTRSLGKSLTQGSIPTGGWFFPQPDKLNPVTIGFYERITRASAQECWKYFIYGDMLKPPVIHVPQIIVSYLKPVDNLYYLDQYDRHLLKEYSVQHSVWRALDGDVGYFFINISEQMVSFDTEISAYSGSDCLYDVYKVLNGCRENIFIDKNMPINSNIVLPPLSIMLVEVKKVYR